MTKEKIAELEEYAKEDLMYIKNDEDQVQFFMRKERKKTAEKALKIINELQAELDLVKLDRDAGIEINAELEAENNKLKEALKNFLDDKSLKEAIETNTKLEKAVEFMKNEKLKKALENG